MNGKFSVFTAFIIGLVSFGVSPRATAPHIGKTDASS